MTAYPKRNKSCSKVIVLYSAIDAISRADLMIVAGTSLRVYPASGLIRFFRGKKLVVINKEHLYLDGVVTLEINDPVGKVLSEIDDL